MGIELLREPRGTDTQESYLTNFGYQVNVKVVFTFPDTNITALVPIGGPDLLVGEWGAGRRLVRVNTRDSSATILPRLELGTPYGTYFDTESESILVTYIGALSKEETVKVGGIAAFRR